MNVPQKNSFQDALAKVMIYGVLISAAVMLVGGLVYLRGHGKDHLHDHIFHSEPRSLTHPVSIIADSLKGNDRSFIQLGVLLLLLNPLVRVAFAAVGYQKEHDSQYAIISTIVFAVLLFSFFW